MLNGRKKFKLRSGTGGIFTVIEINGLTVTGRNNYYAMKVRIADVVFVL